MTDPYTHTRPLPPPRRRTPAVFDTFMVSRRINTPVPRLATMLTDPTVLAALRTADLGGGGTLVLDRLELGDRQAWTGGGRIRHAGIHLVTRTAIDIEISGWSSEATQLHLAPRARHPYRWGPSRSRRYHRLAHLAADHIWRTLHHATAVPAAPSQPSLSPQVTPEEHDAA